MTTFRMTVGRLLCGRLRDYLDGCKFRGADISYLESSGWVEREFIIKGDDNHMITVRASLIAWCNDNA